MRRIALTLATLLLFPSAIMAQSAPTPPSAPGTPTSPSTPTQPGNGGSTGVTAFDRLNTDYLTQARRDKDVTPNAQNYSKFRK